MRVSDCHQASLVLVRESDHGGTFQCSDCGQKCKAMKAVSNCCSADVTITSEKYPFVCSMCRGYCELADPDKAMTYEEIIDQQVLEIIRALRTGKVTEKEAWERLTFIVDDERRSVERQILNGIMVEVEGMLDHPEDPQMKMFYDGMDTAVEVLRRVVQSIASDPEGK